MLAVSFNTFPRDIHSYYCFFHEYVKFEQVVSPFPPSDKIGIKSVQRETEEIVPMKQMKMDWVPYIPFENRSLIAIDSVTWCFSSSNCRHLFNFMWSQGISS